MEVGESSSFIPKAPHFFKIMLHESIQSGTLTIPKKFVRKYGMHLSNSDTVLLKVPTHDAWIVELRTGNGSVWLEKGWPEFLSFYSIKHGDFLVFRHGSGSCSNEFDVVIFDNSSTEIEYPMRSRVNSSEMENICEDSVTPVEAQVHLPSRRITSRKSHLQQGSYSTSKDNALSKAPSSCFDNPNEPTSQGGTDTLERGKSGKGPDSSRVPWSNPTLKLGSLKLQDNSSVLFPSSVVTENIASADEAAPTEFEGRPGVESKGIRQSEVHPEIFLRIARGDWFFPKLNRHNQVDVFKIIEDALCDGEEMRRFRGSCFGHFMEMDRNMSFSGTLATSILLREIRHGGPRDEMRFTMDSEVVTLSRREFCLITGLKFGTHPGKKYEPPKDGVLRRYFQQRDDVNHDDVRAIVAAGNFERPYDVVKLCLILLLRAFIWGSDRRTIVPVWCWGLVERLEEFDTFPWGNLVYQYTVKMFRQTLHRPERSGSDVKCNLYGFSWVLQILAFEMIRETQQLPKVVYRDDMSEYPRICQWSFDGRPSIKKIKDIFKDGMDVLLMLEPTADERRRPYYRDLEAPSEAELCPSIPFEMDENNEQEGGDGGPNNGVVPPREI